MSLSARRASIHDAVASADRHGAGIRVEVARPRDGVATLTAAGELDFAAATGFGRGVREAEAADLLVLDLRELALIDSVGLREILRADQRARMDGRRLVLAIGPGHVRRVLWLTRLDERIEIVEDPDDVIRPGGR